MIRYKCGSCGASWSRPRAWRATKSAARNVGLQSVCHPMRFRISLRLWNVRKEKQGHHQRHLPRN